MSLKAHLKFVNPDTKDGSLWRIMSYTNFLRMLRSKRFHISNATVFPDPYDCMYPDSAIDLVRNQAFLAAADRLHASEVYRRADPWERLRLESKAGRDQPRHGDAAFKAFKAKQAAFKQELFVTCWSHNDGESAAFWPIYSRLHTDGGSKSPAEFRERSLQWPVKQDGPAVALRTSCEAFRTWLGGHSQLADHDVYVGKVRYFKHFRFDYPKRFDRDEYDLDDQLSIVTSKRKAFDFEKEVRGVIRIPGSTGETPLLLDFQLTDMQIDVILDPNAKDEWLDDLRGQIAKVYGDKHGISVQRSTLYELYRAFPG